jgi:hypothetical protein
MFVGVFSVSRAHADTHFSLQIGAPVVVAPPVVVQPAPVAPVAYDGYYWVPAYRAWTGFGYRWVPGRWAQRDYRDHGRFDRGHERGRNFDDRGRWHR